MRVRSSKVPVTRRSHVQSMRATSGCEKRYQSKQLTPKNITAQNERYLHHIFPTPSGLFLRKSLSLSSLYVVTWRFKSCAQQGSKGRPPLGGAWGVPTFPLFQGWGGEEVDL